MKVFRLQDGVISVSTLKRTYTLTIGNTYISSLKGRPSAVLIDLFDADDFVRVDRVNSKSKSGKSTQSVIRLASFLQGYKVPWIYHQAATRADSPVRKTAPLSEEDVSYIADAIIACLTKWLEAPSK